MATGSSTSTSWSSARRKKRCSTCPKDAARCAILGEPQSALGDFAPNNPQAVIDYLEYHRAFKTPYEIAMMREATRRGVRAHRAAERAFRAGASEFGIHLAYCQAAGQDAGELPYGNIVALNEHGAVLHYTELDRLPPQAGAQLPDRCRRAATAATPATSPARIRPTPATSSRR